MLLKSKWGPKFNTIYVIDFILDFHYNRLILIIFYLLFVLFLFILIFVDFFKIINHFFLGYRPITVFMACERKIFGVLYNIQLLP